MGFHCKLVQVVPNVVKLPHHRKEVRGWCFLGDNAVDKMAQIGGNRQVTASCFFLKISGFCFVQP